MAHLGPEVTPVNFTFITKHGLNIISSTLNAIPFCLVYETVTYGSNETIHMEIWLPDADEYNGKFLVIGNVTSRRYLRTANIPQVTVAWLAS